MPTPYDETLGPPAQPIRIARERRHVSWLDMHALVQEVFAQFFVVVLAKRGIGCGSWLRPTGAAPEM